MENMVNLRKFRSLDVQDARVHIHTTFGTLCKQRSTVGLDVETEVMTDETTRRTKKTLCDHFPPAGWRKVSTQP